MDRLTHSGTKQAKDNTTISSVVARLCKYEDTGLTPGNITYQTAQLQEWQRKCDLMHRDNAQLRTDLEQVKTERGAAVEDLQIMADGGSCDVCAYDGQSCKDAVHKADVNGGSCFKWRGLEGRA